MDLHTYLNNFFSTVAGNWRVNWLKIATCRHSCICSIRNDIILVVLLLNQCACNLPFEMLVISVSAFVVFCVAENLLQQTLSTHLFFFLPGPPNLGMSRQNLQEPQSLARHPKHTQASFLRFWPENEIPHQCHCIIVILLPGPAWISIGIFWDTV